MDDHGFPGPVAPPGTSAYYVIRLAPRTQQDALVALFGWRRELIRIATAAAEPVIGRIKLQWWREELERAAGGRAQHPLAHRLGAAAATRGLPMERLDAMAEATDADLRGEMPRTLDDLLAHCDLGGGAFGELLAHVGGEAPDAGRQLGAAVRLIEVLRDVGAELRRSRCRLPHAELAGAGLALATLLQTHRRTALGPMLARLAAHAEIGRRPAGPAGRWYALRHALLDEIRRDPAAVLDAHVSITPLRKLWIAWRE